MDVIKKLSSSKFVHPNLKSQSDTLSRVSQVLLLPTLVLKIHPNRRLIRQIKFLRSSSPSACQDDINWAITVGGTQITCAGMSNQQWCNDYNAHVGTNDKTNEQACCNCGGSLFESSPPSTSPSQVPSQQPAACLDVSAWVSVNGNYNCAINTCTVM